MVNWRLRKVQAQIILIVGALLLFGLGSSIGIESLSEEVMFLPFTWSQLIAAGLIYALFLFNSLTNA